MKRVLFSLAAALALAVPSFAQVAQIGDTTYDTLAAAFADATTGNIISLVADTTVENPIEVPAGKTLTLNLGTYTVTATNTSNEAAIKNAGNLTIRGSYDSPRPKMVVAEGAARSLIENTGTLAVSSQYAICATDGVTPEGLTLEGRGAPVIRNTGTMNIYPGAVITLAEGTDDYAIVSSGTRLVVSKGYANAKVPLPQISGPKGILATKGYLTVAEGTVSATQGPAVLVNPTEGAVTAFFGPSRETATQSATIVSSAGDAVVIEGSVTNKPSVTFRGNATYRALEGKAAVRLNAQSDELALTFTYGIFEGAIETEAGASPLSAFIKRGTFSVMPDTTYLAPGFIFAQNDDGSFGVIEGTYIASIGDVKYASLQAAFGAATATDTIKLLSTVTDTPRLTLTNDKTVTIDLNGHDIGFVQGAEGIPAGYFFVNGGALTLTGKGKVYEQGPYYGVILIKGSTEDIADYSVVDVGKDVTLEGWAPLFIDNNAGCAYGVKVTMAGTANSVKDITGAGGHGVYINGSIKKIEGNVPQITLTETSKVTSLGNGIYAAGYAHWMLAGDVSGADALSIKSGTFTITGGDYRGTGSFADPAEAHGNGSENTGAAVTITTNDGYAQAPIVMDISGTPTFTSVNGYAFYEGIAVNGEKPAATASRAVIAIKGGDFTGSKTNEAITADIAITTAKNKQVVSGGTFSKPVALAYCAPGYIPVVGTEGKYTVDGTAVAAVANPDAQGAYLGYGTLDALIKASMDDGTEVLIMKPDALGEEDANLLKTATGGDNAASGAAAYDVAETLGGTFKVQDGAIVYAYQLGISKIAISRSDITVAVRLEEAGAPVTRTLAGRKVRVVSDKTVLAEADAIFTDGACVLTVPAANLPAGNLELTISVAPAAEAETLAE